MGDFLHGWRRKSGVVTLVMAALLTGGWIRSLERSDIVAVNARPWRYCVQSVLGHLCLVRTTPIADSPLFDFYLSKVEDTWNVLIDESGTPQLVPGDSEVVGWSLEWYGFHLRDGMTDRNSEPFRIGKCVIPYWSIVLPTILLSAYLILWPDKRPERKAKAPVEDK